MSLESTDLWSITSAFEKQAEATERQAQAMETIAEAMVVIAQSQAKAAGLEFQEDE